MTRESDPRATAWFATVLIVGFIGIYLWDIVRSEPSSNHASKTFTGTVIAGPKPGYSRDRSLTFQVRLDSGLVVDARGISVVHPEYRGPVEIERSAGEWTGIEVYEIRRALVSDNAVEP